MTDSEKLVEVFNSPDLTQVQIARDMLASNGIEAFVFDGETSRILHAYGALPARLLVYEDCLDEARDQLKELGFT